MAGRTRQDYQALYTDFQKLLDLMNQVEQGRDLPLSEAFNRFVRADAQAAALLEEMKTVEGRYALTEYRHYLSLDPSTLEAAAFLQRLQAAGPFNRFSVAMDLSVGIEKISKGEVRAEGRGFRGMSFDKLTRELGKMAVTGSAPPANRKPEIGQEIYKGYGPQVNALLDWMKAAAEKTDTIPAPLPEIEQPVTPSSARPGIPGPGAN